MYNMCLILLEPSKVRFYGTWEVTWQNVLPRFEEKPWKISIVNDWTDILNIFSAEASSACHECLSLQYTTLKSFGVLGIG